MESFVEMALIDGPDDIVLIKKPYCNKCATKKLDILETYNVNHYELLKLMQCNTKTYAIKCDCKSKTGLK
jgi:hypothetical protein